MDETTEPAVVELESTSSELLPLNVRRIVYLIGIALLVAGPVVSEQFGGVGDALATGGSLLAAVGLGTALANPTR